MSDNGWEWRDWVATGLVVISVGVLVSILNSIGVKHAQRSYAEGVVDCEQGKAKSVKVADKVFIEKEGKVVGEWTKPSE